MKLHVLLLSLARIDSERKHTRATKAKSRDVLVQYSRSLKHALEVFCRSLLLAELDGISVLQFRTRARRLESPVIHGLVKQSSKTYHKHAFFQGMAALSTAHQSKNVRTLKMAGKSQTMARSVED
eukprot:5993286-Amphidinium_carterae.1